MPLFDYECKDCGSVFEVFLPGTGNPAAEIVCELCNKEKARRVYSLGRGGRSGNGRSFWSKSMGVLPEQIPEMKQHFPDHTYHPQTGDLLVEGPRHRNKLCKELGMIVR